MEGHGADEASPLARGRLAAAFGAGSIGRWTDQHVWLADQTPARVAGSGFRAKERVAIVLTSGKVTLRKSVVTTATGRLQASWNTSIAGGCRPTWIAAIGAKGSRAVYREVANDCGPIPGKL